MKPKNRILQKAEVVLLLNKQMQERIQSGDLDACARIADTFEHLSTSLAKDIVKVFEDTTPVPGKQVTH